MFACITCLIDLKKCSYEICQVVREKILTGVADSSGLAEAFPCCKQLFFRKKNHWTIIKLEFRMFNVGFWYSFILICCWHLGFDLLFIMLIVNAFFVIFFIEINWSSLLPAFWGTWLYIFYQQLCHGNDVKLWCCIWFTLLSTRRWLWMWGHQA